MLEKAFGSVGVGRSKGKASEGAFRGVEPAQPIADEKELKLGDVPGRALDATRAEQVYTDAASNMESAIERTAKQAKLRDEIAFLESELKRYAASLERLEAQRKQEKDLMKKLSLAKQMDDLPKAIEFATAEKAALEKELQTLE